MYSFACFILAFTNLFARVCGIVLGVGETVLVIYLLVTKQWVAAAFMVFIGTMILHFAADIIVKIVAGLALVAAQLISPKAVADYAGSDF